MDKLEKRVHNLEVAIALLLAAQGKDSPLTRNKDIVLGGLANALFDATVSLGGHTTVHILGDKD